MSCLKSLCLKGTLISLCLILTSFNVAFYDSHSVPMSIDQALQNNLINCNITSNGGHEGKCVNMQLTNISEHNINVIVESGRNFASNDTNKQDILIVKEELFVLNRGETEQKDLFGFCSQSHKGSPANGEEYQVDKMKNEKTVLLTKHLAKNEYPLSAMQSAIWVMTNNRRVEGIYHENRDTIQSLMDYVSGLTYQFTPWYSIQYHHSEGDLVSDSAQSIHGNFDARLEANTKVKVVVFDMFNNARLRKEIMIIEKGSSHPVSIDVSGLSKGRYYIGFYILGAGRLEEKVFSI